jgi:hypothetical protein
MVHAVVAGAAEPAVEPAQLAHLLRVHPELVQQVDQRHHAEDQRRHPRHRHRQVEDPAEQEAAARLAQRGAQVVVLALVVHHVRRPQHRHAVAGAVQPVVAEVVAQQRKTATPRATRPTARTAPRDRTPRCRSPPQQLAEGVGPGSSRPGRCCPARRSAGRCCARGPSRRQTPAAMASRNTGMASTMTCAPVMLVGSSGLRILGVGLLHEVVGVDRLQVQLGRGELGVDAGQRAEGGGRAPSSGNMPSGDSAPLAARKASMYTARSPSR